MRFLFPSGLLLLAAYGSMAAAQTATPDAPAPDAPVPAAAAPAPAAAAANGAVTATIVVSGQGTVRWSGGICGPVATCTATLAPGKLIAFKSVPLRGAALVEWTGACSGYAATCKVTPGGDFTLSARYGITATR